jgi:hypothetical protein
VPPGTYSNTSYQSQPYRVAQPPLDFEADVTVPPDSLLEVTVEFSEDRKTWMPVGKFWCSDPHSLVRFLVGTKGWVQITARVTGTITLNALTITT